MATQKRNIQAIHGLTPMQEGILFHTLHAPGSGLYVEQYRATLEGALDLEALRRAFAHVVSRHAALRALFTWEETRTPLQIVRARVDLPWTIEDWRSMRGDERRERLERMLAADRARGFRLDEAPLMRLACVRIAEDRHWLVWSFHHLLLDGWSMRLVLREVLDAYAALRAGERPATSPPPAYSAYLAWLRARDAAADEAHWRRHLEGFTTATPLDLETRAPGSPWAEHHDTLEHRLDEAATRALSERARALRVTMSTLLRGAWALLLSRYAGEEDVVFGATVSGRAAPLERIEEMVGLLINTVPVRARVSPERRLAAGLPDPPRAQLEAVPHEATPLVDIQRWSEVRGPLFSSILVVENHPAGAGAPPTSGLRVTEAHYVEQSNFPLAVLAVPGDALELHLVYDRDRFARPTIARLAGHLETLLAGMTAGGDPALGEIPLVPDAEGKALLAAGVGPALEAPGEACIHELIQRHVRATPDAPAVRFEEVGLTYGELGRRAAALATTLRALGVGANVAVGLIVERSPEMIVGILGILEAGGAYVPIDPGQPAERTAFMLGETRARAVVTLDRHAGAIPEGGWTIVALDDPKRPERGDGDRPETPPAGAEDRAYVLYTSGSTGRPKGVAVTHRNLVHSTHARLAYYPEPPARFCLVSPIFFDSSVAGIFWTLAGGGTLVLPPPRMEQDVAALGDLLARARVSHLLALPALYALLLEHAGARRLASLETVILAGEACPPAVVRAHFAALGETALYNEYGPTEATVWCTVHRIDPADAQSRVPIGRPIPDARVHVLDRSGRPAPAGVPGELHVGGAGVAEGYVGDEALTARAFILVALPGGAPLRLYRTGDRARLRSDGTLEFLGRTDDQVKIRGHRVELGEIEQLLETHPDVGAAAAVCRTGSLGEDLLHERLTAMDPGEATRLLDEIERLTPEEIDAHLAGDGRGR